MLPAHNPAKAKVVREVLATPKPRKDALQREQLTAWFAAVRGLSNAPAAAYLQVLLLTGARPGGSAGTALAGHRPQVEGIDRAFRDKVEGERVIPLTPYVDALLHGLPKINEWVFASRSSDQRMAHKAMSTPHKLHDRACQVAGIEGLTLHGLRRSFKSLTEWLEIPAGVVAQLMGHKPSATAEKHYTVRPLDLLRLHHEKIEAWMLAQAQVAFESGDSQSPLRRVK
ncbi:MAG: tyrosine-type recombinase/integrase [Giesbergeria sp.]